MKLGRIALIFLASALLEIFVAANSGAQTSSPGTPSSGGPPSGGPPPVSIGALIDQAVALFPRVETEILEVQGRNVTLAVGRASGLQPGIVLEVVREGREIRHPRTGQVLGNAEQSLGRAVIAQVSDRFSTAQYEGEPAQPGDRVRTTGKVKLTLLTLTSLGVKSTGVEPMTNEIYEGLSRTGHFQLVFGEQIAAWLTQEKIAPEEFVQGKGVTEASGRFKADNLLVLHYKMVDRKPFLDARVFVMGRSAPSLTTSFFVPASLKAPVGRFSGSDKVAQNPERKPRSLLQRLLGWGSDTSAYSSAETSLALKEIARLSYTVVSMDVAMTPADRIPRVVITDGQKVFVYKIVNQAFEGDWTYSERAFGRIFSVQFADLTGSGRLEVVANRYDPRTGMNSFILGVPKGKPEVLVEDIESILMAVDEQGGGVKKTLWAQRFRKETFFTKGQADEMVIKNGSLVKVKSVPVPDTFRATGATFTNVNGKTSRALAFIDEQNRLRVSVGTEELYRSGSVVGGGGEKIEVIRDVERGGRSYFFQLEPTPLAIDLDGDGVEEIIVPQNQIDTGGLIGIIFRGPAGLRFQQVNSGFDGMIRAIGSIPGEDGGQPSLIAAVVRYKNFLKVSGETQLIMTLPQE